MREDGGRPERIESADFYLRAMRDARDARARLEAQTLSDRELAAIQQVLRGRVLHAIADKNLFVWLADLERAQDRAAPERPGIAGHRPSMALPVLPWELLDDANLQSPDAVRYGELWTPQHTVAGGVQRHVAVFIDTARPFADEPVPPADDPGRPAWIQGLKAILDKAVDVLLSLAVAAAFTMPAVQLAAQHVVSETVDVAGRALEHTGQVWPSLIAVGAAAVHAAAGVSVAKQAWESVRSARAEATAVTGHVDDHNRPAAWRGVASVPGGVVSAPGGGTPAQWRGVASVPGGVVSAPGGTSTAADDEDLAGFPTSADHSTTKKPTTRTGSMTSSSSTPAPRTQPRSRPDQTPGGDVAGR